MYIGSILQSSNMPAPLNSAAGARPDWNLVLQIILLAYLQLPRHSRFNNLSCVRAVEKLRYRNVHLSTVIRVQQKSSVTPFGSNDRTTVSLSDLKYIIPGSISRARSRYVQLACETAESSREPLVTLCPSAFLPLY